MEIQKRIEIRLLDIIYNVSSIYKEIFLDYPSIPISGREENKEIKLNRIKKELAKTLEYSCEILCLIAEGGK